MYYKIKLLTIAAIDSPPHFLCMSVFPVIEEILHLLFEIIKLIYCNIFKAELGSLFSKNRIFFSVEDRLLPVIHMASSDLQKMLTFMILGEMFGKM